MLTILLEFGGNITEARRKRNLLKKTPNAFAGYPS